VGLRGQLQLEPLGLAASLLLEVGRQLPRLLADLGGRLLGGFEIQVTRSPSAA
jgi:hypothetical protein